MKGHVSGANALNFMQEELGTTEDFKPLNDLLNMNEKDHSECCEETVN